MANGFDYSKRLEVLLNRCEYEGDCLIWPGALRGGAPLSDIEPGRQVMLRRYVYQSTHSVKLSSKLCVRMKCDCGKCLNVEHMYVAKKSSVSKENRNNITVSGRLSYTSHIRKSKSKLTIDDVREIRSSPDTGIAMAEKFNVSRTTISAIRRGARWKDVVSNPFSGLIA